MPTERANGIFMNILPMHCRRIWKVFKTIHRKFPSCWKQPFVLIKHIPICGKLFCTPLLNRPIHRSGTKQLWDLWDRYSPWGVLLLCYYANVMPRLQRKQKRMNQPPLCPNQRLWHIINRRCNRPGYFMFNNGRNKLCHRKKNAKKDWHNLFF